MKTKTEAAKVLLENGFTFEEVQKLLEPTVTVTPAPIIIKEREIVRDSYIPPYPWRRYPWDGPFIWQTPPYKPMEFWCGTNGNALTLPGRPAGN